MSMDALIKTIISNLSKSERYSRLVNNAIHQMAPSFVFELLFVNSFEINGIELEYEVNITEDNDSTVDFIFKDNSGSIFCFELVSPEMSEELGRACNPEPTDIEGVSSYSILMASRHLNPYLRPEALTIRMQEKLLDKMYKFPPPTDNMFSSIVVDCSNFHFGHFDDEDCRMVMFGRTQNPYFQEFWNGRQIKGLLYHNNDSRGAKEFRNRITSVIFVSKTAPNLLDEAFLVLNELRSREHLEAFWSKLANNAVFNKLRYVPPPESTTRKL